MSTTPGFKLQPFTTSRKAFVDMMAEIKPEFGFTEANLVLTGFVPSPVHASQGRTFVTALQMDSDAAELIEYTRLGLSEHITPRLSLTLPFDTLSMATIVAEINRLAKLSLEAVDVSVDAGVIVAESPYYLKLTALAESPVWYGSMLIKVEAKAPDGLLAVVVNANGLSVTGKGESGATVTVRGAGEIILGTGPVNTDGNFNVTLTSAQTNGEVLTLIQTNAFGLSSAPVTVVARDSTAPSAPTAVTISTDGRLVSGKGEVASTATVKGPASVTLGTAIVDDSGNFAVTLSAAQTNGQALSVTLTDAAGNISSPTQVVARDTTAPNAPTNLAVSVNGLTLTGKGEANSVVKATSSSGVTLGTGTVIAAGTFSVTLNPAQRNGETITVIQTDVAGNASTTTTVKAGDTTAPTAPTSLNVSVDGLTITGTGEIGSTVNVIDETDVNVGNGTVGSDGTFTVTFTEAQTGGKILGVTLTDVAGNVSLSATVVAGTAPEPEEPVIQ